MGPGERTRPRVRRLTPRQPRPRAPPRVAPAWQGTRILGLARPIVVAQFSQPACRGLPETDANVYPSSKHIHTRVSQRSGGLMAFCVIGYIVAWISWVLVGFNLSRAKGYSKDFTGTLFMVVYFIGICFPILVVGFPLYILFGMEDRAKDRSRRR